MPIADGAQLEEPSVRREALLWEATSDYLESISSEAADAGYRAAIVHWFDEEILAALLDPASPIDGLTTDEPGPRKTAWLYDKLRRAPFVEVRPHRGHAYHSLTRRIVLDRLWRDRPGLVRSVSASAARYFGREFESGEEANWEDVLEYTYHLLLVDETEGINLSRSLVALLSETGELARVHSLVTAAEEHAEAGRLSPEGRLHVRVWQAWAALANQRYEEALAIAKGMLEAGDDAAGDDIKDQAARIATLCASRIPGPSDDLAGSSSDEATVQGRSSVVDPSLGRRLVGRGLRLAALEVEHRRAAAGSFRCVLMSGDNGVGKSRLATEFIKRVSSDSTALVARADPLEKAPLSVWVKAFESHLSRMDRTEVEALAGAFADDLAPLLPSVAAVHAPQRNEPRPDRFLPGLATLLAGLTASSTVLIVLDDMHLADGPSWEALHYLANRLARAPVLLVVVTRSAELQDHPVARRVVAGLERDGVLRRLRIGPLDRAAVGQLADEVLAEQATPAVAQWLAEHSRGNPLFALFLLETLAEQEARAGEPRQGSPEETATGAVLTQLRDLDELQVSTLELLATIGQPVALSDLADLIDRPLGELAPALERLVASGFAVEEESGRGVTYEMAHPLIEQLIVESVTGAKRRSLHRLVAQALLVAGRLGSEAARLLETAPMDDPEALEVLRETIHRAEKEGAAKEATTIVDALVELLPADDLRWPEVLEALSWRNEGVLEHRTEPRAGLGIEALRKLDRVLDNSSDTGARAWVKFRLGSLLAWGNGELEEAETFCLAARDLFEQVNDQRGALLARNEIAWVLFAEARFDSAGAVTRGVLSEAREAGDTFVTAQAQATIAYVALVQGQLAEAEKSFAEVIELMGEQADGRRIVASRSGLALVHAFAGRIDQSLALLEECRRTYPEYRETVLMDWSIVVQWFAGDFPAALAGAEEAFALNAGDLGRRRLFVMPFAAVAAAEMGASEKAGHYLEESRDPHANQPRFVAGDSSSWAEAVILLLDGRAPEAVEVLSNAVERASSIGMKAWAALLLHDLAEAAAAAGEKGRAMEAALQLAEIAEVIGEPLYRALGLAALGWAHLVNGDPSAAGQSASEAVELLSPLHTKALLARTLDLLGQSLAPSDRDQAIEAFGRAASLFAECGAVERRSRLVWAMQGLASRNIRTEASTRGLASLTHRERQVAQMVTGGYSLKDIAQRLAISQNTVETHLRHVYAKLGVDSRAELAHLTRLASDQGA